MPVSLLDSATWAGPRIAPFIRMAVAHAVSGARARCMARWLRPWRRAEASRRWRRVADAADVLAGQGAPPDPGLPLLPPLPIAAIPLPDGMAVPLAAFGAVPVGRWVPHAGWGPHHTYTCRKRVISANSN